eukprot:CAMPEP_0170537836 /NCGR_PEP_ID=MMETSP0209-20121228/102954_1 /TAXON_ID=665100 ORGANISM="Litonotus pictus, Strain P1" /NCGR_SAMPLE_ID=MMETSP0209 /ASSEMBLY_ACC=CAM_ASM_000301 /LENGTH=296 /DNA_ID=CAMNT_0010839415 /DNA_START=908 /DNA_END=1798 /DNA_ORIENTATION=+
MPNSANAGKAKDLNLYNESTTDVNVKYKTKHVNYINYNEYSKLEEEAKKPTSKTVNSVKEHSMIATNISLLENISPLSKITIENHTHNISNINYINHNLEDKPKKLRTQSHNNKTRAKPRSNEVKTVNDKKDNSQEHRGIVIRENKIDPFFHHNKTTTFKASHTDRNFNEAKSKHSNTEKEGSGFKLGNREYDQGPNVFEMMSINKKVIGNTDDSLPISSFLSKNKSQNLNDLQKHRDLDNIDSSLEGDRNDFLYTKNSLQNTERLNSTHNVGLHSAKKSGLIERIQIQQYEDESD